MLTRIARHKYTTAAVAALFHIPPLTLLSTGAGRRDWIAFGVLYLANMFALGGAMHRYFAHRAYRTSRAFQLLMAVLGSVFFADVIGFVGRHRLHHRNSDTEADVHSPLRGWWQCWVGSLLDDGVPEQVVLENARDWTRYPELVWLHRYFFLPGFATAALTWWFGGYTMFACAYCLIFLVSFHGPSALNWLGHRGDRRPFDTGDLSSNSLFLGFVLFGEGWHNNHHQFPNSARAGLHWYEFDGVYYWLKLLSWVGLIWDLRQPPAAVEYAFRESAERGESCALR